MKHTEEQKLCPAPIKVVLGGKEYEVKPLPIKESREWRAKVAEALGQLPNFAKVTSDDPDVLKQAMDAILMQIPDTIADIFFAYAKDLPREEIEATATDAELAKAFGEVAAVGFGLTSSLIGVLGASNKGGG